MVINPVEITAVLATAVLMVLFGPARRVKSQLLRTGLLMLQLGIWLLIVSFAVAYTASTPMHAYSVHYGALSGLRRDCIWSGLIGMGAGVIMASFGYLMYVVDANRRMTERLHHAEREAAKLDFPSGVTFATVQVRHD